MFLKGPIPWAWLVAAASLPGRALHVGIALWLRVGLERKYDVVMPLAALAPMGVDRHAARRGLAELEKAGLVNVTRHRGRKARVAVLACQRNAGGGDDVGMPDDDPREPEANTSIDGDEELSHEGDETVGEKQAGPSRRSEGGKTPPSGLQTSVNVHLHQPRHKESSK
jgi:hypothetical protein